MRGQDLGGCFTPDMIKEEYGDVSGIVQNPENSRDISMHFSSQIEGSSEADEMEKAVLLQTS